MASAYYLYDILSELIDNIRERGNITAVTTLLSGKYDVTAVNDLQKNDVVNIYSNTGDVYENVFVESATPLNFVVSVDFFDPLKTYTYKALAPYFMHEKPAKAVEILTEMTGDVRKWRKYPLILLFHPYKVYRNKAHIFGTADFTISILNETEAHYTSDERSAINYKPILYPLYYQLLQQIKESTYFKPYNLSEIQHTLTEQHYVEVNPLNDILDALTIEFKGLEINVIDCLAEINLLTP